MNKKTISLPNQQGEWGSYISKYQPDSQKVLDNMFTSGSKNFVTDQTGMIDKRQGGVQWNRTSFGNVAKDSYEAVFESGSRHFLRVGAGTLSASTGTGLFDTITSGYSSVGFFEWATYQDRVYGCNGINVPQVYDTVTSYGGVTYSFTTGKTKTMGSQAPASAPTSNAPTAGGSIPVGSHSYKVTFLYYDAEESNGSPSSAIQTTTSGNQTISITNLPIGGYSVTARRIYRDNNDGVYLLLAQISDNTTTSYSDTLFIGGTPTPIPQFNNTPPTFSKIALWLDSLWIAPTGETNTLRYSVTGSPDIFDPANFVRCQSDDIITAITVYNGKLYVHGLHSFGSIEGTTPDTFNYHNISNNIGCTDNRSIQIRSIVSVPTLWWLSDKGLYYSNGYTVEYGSDLIQDLVNLNLAQVNYSSNKNTQTSFAAFSGDTSSPGIDINSQPGAVTTISPTKVFSTNVDWSGGSSLTNVVTSSSTNTLTVPTSSIPSFSSGSFTNTSVVNSTLRTPVYPNNEGISVSEIQQTIFNQPYGLYEKFSFPRAGVVSGLQLSWTPINSTGYSLEIRGDSGGLPGALNQVFPLTNEPVGYNKNTLPSFAVDGGTIFWIGIAKGGHGNFSQVGKSAGVTNALGRVVGQFGVSSFTTITGPTSNGTIDYIFQEYTFTQTSVAASGSWLGPSYDSKSDSAVSALISHTGVFPSSSFSTTTVEAANDSAFTSGLITQSFSSLNGSTAVSLSGRRYWRVRISLQTPDDRVSAQIGQPSLAFNTTGTWISAAVNTTTDNVLWGSLTSTGNSPLSTNVTLTMSTSPDNVTYSSFGPIGSALVQKWAKVKAILTTTPDNATSASISSITLTWSLISQIESSAIDTGTTPAGFGTAQWEEIDFSSGSVVMYIRTASSPVGLSSASYVAVLNGAFPNLTPLRYVQWKLILSSSTNNSPVITSVTVNWFVGSGVAGVRCASIFYNKTYYLSVATIGSTANNIIIQLDQFGNWRIQKDNSVGTFLLYYNTLYFADGITDNIYNGFIADTDNGSAITMDVRTRAWNENVDMFLKIPRGLKITGIHTGTTLHAYYSNDRGATWIEMLNEKGQMGFITDNSKTEFTVLFVPDASTLVSGRTLMFRIVSSDVYPCSILNFEPSMYTRGARYLNNG